MADFKTHLTASTLVGLGLGAAGYHYGLPLESCLLSAGLCSASGILPDLDADGGVPFRELVAFLSAVVSLLLVQRLEHLGWSRETVVLVAALIYLVIRFGVAGLFRRYTVHRGMWHSIPAAVSMGLLTFLIAGDRDIVLRGYWATSATIGFLVHLVLDELYSVNMRGMRLKKSAGSALKLWTRKRLWPNISTYGKLALLALLVWSDPSLAVPPPHEEADAPRAARQAERVERPERARATSDLFRERRRRPRTATPGAYALLSTRSVTGPSLTRATSMWARNRPVATRTPQLATARAKCS